MKTLFAVVVSFALAIAAQAQFVQGPICVSAFSNNIGVVVIAGNTTSNLPTDMVRTFPLGRTGFGFGVTLAGTNAATTTNTLFTFEVSGNGTDYVLNNRPVFSFPALGTGYATYYSNVVATSACIDNAILVRLRSIQNTNIDSLFITNTCLNTR